MNRDQQVRRWVSAWAKRWKVPRLARDLTIRFSPRLRRSWGRASSSRRTISLNTALQDAPAERLREVVCHEFAHLAVTELNGRRVKPHGKEWAALVRSAGFRPSRFKPPTRRTKRPAATPASRYEHWCPVCQMKRTAKRRMPKWRCASCVDAGLEGVLRIRQLPSVTNP